MRAMRSGVSLLPAALVRTATALISALVGAVAVAAAGESQTVSDSGHLHLVSSKGGSALHEAGKASGTLPGTVTVALTIHTSTATSSFTIDVQGGGSIYGKASGALKTGKGGYASFGGHLTVAGGTGKYAHASGTGGLYGVIDRYNDALTVKVQGTLQY